MAGQVSGSKFGLFTAKIILLTVFLVSLALGNVNAVPIQPNTWYQSGPAGGSVGDFVFSPSFSSDNTVYAGYDPGGFFVSTNGGATWVRQSTGLTNNSINDLEISPVNINTIFAATDGGLFRSTDRGQNWSQIEGLPVSQIEKFEAVNSDTFLAGSGDQGVYISADGGLNWSQKNNGLTDLNITSFLVPPGFAETPVIFAGTDGGGIFRSTNGGESWSMFNNGLNDLYLSDLAYNPTGSRLFAATGNGVFEFDNELSSWTGFGFDGIKVHDIDIKGENISAATDNGLYHYSEGWTRAYNSELGTSLSQNGFIELSPDDDLNNTMFGQVDDELLRKTDATGWIRSDNDIYAHDINDIAVAPGNFFAATQFGVYSSEDEGATWTPKNNGLPAAVTGQIETSPNFVNNFIIAGFKSNGIFISNDGGDNWAVANNGLTNLDITDIAVSPNFATDGTLFAGTKEGLFRSQDGGANWTAAGLADKHITDIEISEELILYLAAYDGVYKSENGGNLLESVLLPSALEGSWVANIELKPGGNEIFVHAVDIAEQSKIIRSQNNGSTWTEVTNVPQPVTGMRVLPDIEGSLFVTTDDSAFKYGFTYGGSGPTWEDLGTGLPVTFLEAFQQEGSNYIDLFVGRRGTSILRMKHDKTPPVTTLKYAAPNSNGWYRVFPTINFSTNEPATTLFQWNSTSPGGWIPGQSTVPPAGINTLWFCSSDGPNNENNMSQIFRVDPYNPSASLPSTLRPAGSHIRNNFSFPVDASDSLSGVSRVDILCNGMVLGSDTSAPFAPVIDTRLWGDGQHTLKARATDKAGNTGITRSRIFFFDNLVPKVSKTSVSPASPARGTQAKFNFRLDDVTSPNVDVDLQLFKGTVRKSTFDMGWCTKGSILSKSFTAPSVAGAYTMRTIAKDKAGNKTVKNFNFTVK